MLDIIIENITNLRFKNSNPIATIVDAIVFNSPICDIDEMNTQAFTTATVYDIIPDDKVDIGMHDMNHWYRVINKV